MNYRKEKQENQTNKDKKQGSTHRDTYTEKWLREITENPVELININLTYYNKNINQ